MKKTHLIPMRFAHTGVPNDAPENTPEAYAAAVEAGYEGIEMDINMTRDGEIFCFHGPCFKGVTAGKDLRMIGDLTTEEVRKIDIPYRNGLLPKEPPKEWTEHLAGLPFVNEPDDPENRVTHLITFEEFDRWLGEQDVDITVEVEFKTTGMLPRMTEILKNSKNVKRYIFFSGEMETLEEMQEWYRTHEKPEGLRFGANIRWLNDETMAFIRKSDLYEVGLNNERFTKEDVDFLATMGIKVFSNLGDYPEWWARLAPYGVTGFKTNYAAAYTRWLEQQERK